MFNAESSKYTAPAEEMDIGQLEKSGLFKLSIKDFDFDSSECVATLTFWWALGKLTKQESIINSQAFETINAIISNDGVTTFAGDLKKHSIFLPDCAYKSGFPSYMSHNGEERVIKDKFFVAFFNKHEVITNAKPLLMLKRRVIGKESRYYVQAGELCCRQTLYGMMHDTTPMDDDETTAGVFERISCEPAVLQKLHVAVTSQVTAL